MIRARSIPLALLLACLLGVGMQLTLARAAFAESEAAPEEGDHAAEEGEEEGESFGPLESNDGIVEMPMLVAPITVNQRLYSYAYLRVKLEAASFEDALVIRERVAFVQDGFVREVHRASIALNGDPKRIDGEGLKRRLMKVCDSVLGPGVVIDISFGDEAETAEAPATDSDAGHAEAHASGH